MATKSIGYVVELIGDAQVRSVEGVIRVLSIGDQIHEGDILTTGLNTQIVLEFFDGHKLQVGENTEMLLDESVFAGLNAYPDDRADQLAELQSLIVEGIDLAELEATAAGAASDSDALHQASVYTRVGDEGIVETRGTPFNLGASDLDDQLNDDGSVLIPADLEDSVATQGSGAMPPPATSITVNNITADDVINAVEAGAPINVTGTVGGNAVAGDTVSFTINSTPYSGTVGAGNIFSISVTAVDLVADTSFDATVSGTDIDGNPYSATTTSTHTVDTTAAATIIVNDITADDVVNTVEAAGSIDVTGSVSGDAAPGDTVSFTINGTNYSGSVAGDNTFSINVNGSDLAAQTSFVATVTGSDNAGNPFTATTISTHTYDSTPPNTPPVAVIDLVTTNEDVAVNNINVLGNDSDPDGDALAVTSASSPNGTVSINADGSLNYSPNLNFNGTDVITYSISDGKGSTDTATVTVTVNPVNDTATVSASAGSVTEDDAATLTTSGSVTITDTDAGEAFAIPQASTPGTYGTFSVDANGNWSYQADNTQTAIQELGDTDSLTETFTVVSQDGSASNSVTVTINGTNDAATVSASSGSVTEDDAATLTTSGSVTITDTDAGEAFAQPQASTPGTYGTFSVDANGNWSYQADNTQTAIQELGDTDSLTETFTVTSQDGTASNSVTVTINGANDTATVSASSGSVTEDDAATLTTSGSVTITDTDAGEAFAQPQASTSGTYGTFSVDANGNWSYQADNTQTAIQELGDTDSLTETFTVVSQDGSASNSVTVTINGTNDAATVSASAGSVTEDDAATLTTSGSVTITDTDAGEAFAIPQASTSGTYGTFSVDANGNWSYQADNTQTAIQELGDTDSLTETFTVTSQDGTASNSVTVTINGANDTATVSASAGSVTEDDAATLTTSGSVTITDTDAGEAFAIPQTNTAGTYGTFSVDANGNWSYQADNTQTAIQELGDTDSLTETFTVVSQDGSASNSVTVTINGTNDTATVSASSGSVTEDDAATLTTSGSVTITDTDAGEAFAQPQASTPGTYGTFSVDANGNWSYQADNTQTAIQELGATDSLTETFTVTSQDGSASNSVTVTINGTNDAATVSASAGSVTEDDAATLTTSGSVTITDTDAGEAFAIPQASTPGTYGTFSVDANGNWSYQADNTQTAIQELGDTDSLTETFTVTSQDGTASNTVTVTINGTNDTATVSASAGSVTEDDAATLTTSGSVTITDTDAGEAFAQPQASTPGTYGTFSVDANGNWSYQADNTQTAIQELGDTDSLTETFTVTSQDGTASNSVTVTINGTNDTATVSASSGSVTEDDAATLTTSGSVTITDTDAGEAFAQPQASTPGTYGTFSVDANGNWSYQADNTQTAIQELGATDSLTETFTVTSQDGSASNSVTVTINGTNDAATVSASAGSVTEDDAATLTTSGSVTITDTDAGEAFAIPQASTPGTYGTFSVDANGNWSYQADNTQTAIQELGDTDSLTETFTVTSQDGTASNTVTVTINGTNDTATVSASAGSVTEDDAATLTTSGSVTITDTDAGEAFAQPQASTPGTYGTFSVDANGNWSYQADNTQTAIQELGDTDSLTETFTVTSQDGTASNSVTVTINGTNDGPVAFDSSNNVAEDSLNVALNLPLPTDLDVSDVLTVTVTGLPDSALGSVTLSDGSSLSLSQTLSITEFQGLEFDTVLNATGITSFTYQVSDGTATDNATATITVGGSNDSPVAIDNSYTTDEDNTYSGNVLTDDTGAGIDSDPDGDSLSVSAVNGVTSAIGTPVVLASGAILTMQSDGSFSYDPSTSSAFNALGASDSTTDSFTYTISDGNGAFDIATVTLTINGTNDVATVSASSGSVTEDDAATLTTSGSVTITDTDAGEAFAIPQASTSGTYGTFSVDANGNWSYQADNTQTAIQELGDTDSLTETFTVTSQDGTASNSVTVTINGTNDTATVSASSGSVTEDDAATLTTSGSVTITDTDAGEAFAIPQTNTAGTYGTFSVDANGNWSYQADNTQAAIQELGDTDSLTETFTVVSQDGSASNSVTVTINGTNDTATVSASSGSVTEDDAVTLTTSGSVTITDTDAGEAFAQPQASTSGTYGTFSVDANGNWSYQADNTQTAIQELGDTDSLTETFTVVSQDGSASNSVTVTINGTNDTATVSASSGSVTEDDAVTLTTSGSVTITDTDAGEAFAQPQASTSGTYGTFSVDANGNWSYQADNTQTAIQELGDTDSLTETFTVVSQDGSASNSVTVTINGTNDTATVSASAGSVTEDDAATLTTSGSVTITDTDAGEAFAIPQASTPGTYGTFSVDANGNWSYQADNTQTAIQELGATDSLTETFTVVSQDGSASNSVTVTINGTNDVATVSASSGSVTEDDAATLTTSGSVTITDTDAGEAFAIPQASTPGTYGTFSVDANGNWSYQADNTQAAIQELGDTDSLTETFTVVSQDGSASNSVTVTINGTNDVATVSASSGSVTEDDAATLTTSGSVTITDTDAGEAFAIPQASTPGTYGTFSVDANGNWSYQADNTQTAIQELGATDSLTETFTVVSQDGSASNSVTVTINGTNDVATVSASSGSVTEDDAATLTTSGSVTITDTDAGEAFAIPQASTPGTYGTFSVDANGNWSYQADNTQTAIQELGATDSLIETFTVTSQDGTASNTVTVTINGTNDTATVSASSGSVTEDDAATLTTSGSVTITDTDAGEAFAIPQASTPGTYGTFSVDANGNWSYQADNTQTAIQELGDTDSLTETFTVTSQDGTASNSVTVTINGANDTATVSASSGSVTEDDAATLTTSGSVTITDTDAGEAFAIPQASTPGTYGTFSVDANGNWSYQADNTQAAIQELGDTDSLTETFTVVSQDGSASNSVTVTINGTNDVATVSASSGSVTEDDAATLTTSGSVTITDTDAGEAFAIPQASTPGTYGTFSVDANGNWSYQADNTQTAIQELGATDSLIETFTVTSQDGTASNTVTVTINGTNDTATVSASSGSVTEDDAATLTTSGSVTITDTDAGEAFAIPQASTPGTYGTFSVDANGNWSYQADNTQTAIQELGATDSLIETFTVTSQDGTASNTVTVTINGTNDTATVSASSGSVTEDDAATLTTSGSVTITDTDAGEAFAIPQASTPGTYGTFSVDANGNWSYQADNTQTAIQELGDTDSLTETFTVTSQDGTASNSVTVTINGANDTATVSASSGSVTEDDAATLTTSGSVTITDTDAGEAFAIPQASTPGTYGTFSVDANGNWSYQADNTQTAIQELGATDSLTETFTVVSQDGSASNSVTVTINGTNDVATVSASSGSVTEDDAATLTTSGSVTITDTDAGEAFAIPQASTPGTYGTFSVDANGNWSYQADNTQTAIQELGATDSLIETFTVTSQDGTASNTVTVTINGTNDTATVSASSGSVTEDDAATLTTSGSVTITDTDAGEAFAIPQASTPGTYGTFSVDANGNWSYQADNTQTAIQELGDTDSLTETFTVTSQDGTASNSVTVTINGANDTATVSASSGSVTEDDAATLTTSGSVTITDTDAGEAFAIPQTNTAGTYGTFSVDANGNWSYQADNTQTAIQELGDTDSLTETFTVVSQDGSASNSVTVTINGTNDTATVSASSGSVTEDDAATLTTSGSVTITDTDAGEAFAIPQTNTAGTYGTFSVDANGNWSYQADNTQTAIQELGDTDSLTETFTVVSQDGSASNSVTVTINGTNDTATVSASSGSVTEDDAATLTTSGSVTITDTDAGEAFAIPQASTPGTYGTFSVDANGNWSYQADNTQTAIQELGATDSLTETFTVVSQDGSASNSVTVTINGTNDVATVSASSGSVTEDDAATLTTSGSVTITDTDAGEAFAQPQASTPGTYGTFSVDANGNWSYQADNTQTAIQELGDTDSLTETFTVVSQDGSASNSVTVTINGTNDAATVSASAGSVTEDDAATLTTSGSVTITDTDAGEAFAIPQASTPGTYGTFSVDANGNWSYQADNTQAAIQELGDTDSLTETFTVVSQDGSASNSVTVTINGTNDVATVSASSGSVTEDDAATLTTSGSVTITDTDAGEAFAIPQASTPGTYGTFSVDANGNWSYQADNTQAAIQELGDTDSLTETFTVVSQDGSASNSVTVTINGTNDTATVSASSGSVTEDDAATLTTSGSVTITDTDAGEAFAIPQTNTAGTYGTFSVDANGNWSYQADNTQTAIQELGATDSLIETFTVTSQDGTASNTVTVTINGTNDTATVSASAGSVTEDDAATLTTSGSVTITDTDAGEAFAQPQASTPGTYGTFSVDANGNWSYQADNTQTAIQELGATDSLTETFTVVSQDGSASNSVTVTINGTNDAATVSSANVALAETDVALNTSGTLTSIDVDNPDNTFTASSTVGAIGSFSIDAAGAWTFTANSAFDSLNVGDNVNETFNVTSVDGTPSTVQITINGTNDGPVIDLDADDSAAAGNNYAVTFTEGGSAAYIADTDINISDVDSTSVTGATITVNSVESGDLLTVGSMPAGITASAYDSVTGTITLSGSTSWSDYQDAIRAIQFSNDGSTTNTTRSIDVVVTDGSNNSNTATTDVTINTLPTVTVTDVSVQEPAAGTTSLTFTISIDQTLGSDLTFDYQTADISALAGADFVGISSTVGTITAGSTSTTVTVTVNSDAEVFEGDETLSLDLTNFNQTVNFDIAAHTISGGVQGIGTIGVNDGPPDAVDDSYITTVDTPLVITNALSNDTLVDNAVVDVTGYTDLGSGVYSFNGNNGTVVYDSNTGDFTFTPNSGYAGTADFSYTLIDDDGETDTATVSVDVSSVVVNPPMVSNVPDTAYTENDSPVSLISGVNITDVDSTNLSSVVVTIDGFIGSQDVLDYLTAGTSVVASVAVSGSTWELTLTGGVDINEYETVLDSITYQNSSDNPSTSVRNITIEAFDQSYANLFGSDAGTLSITAVNDAPDVFDNDVFTIESSQNNGLGIIPPTDPDNDDNALIITVTGLPGALGTVTLFDGTPVIVGQTLSLAELTSLEFDAGAAQGNGTFSYTVDDGQLVTTGNTTISVGSTNPDFATVYEGGLADGTGSGPAQVTGNLFANDGNASNSIDSIDFGASNYTPTGGIITATTALGTLTVYADNNTPGFTAGDYVYTLNSPDGTSADVDEVFTYNFTNGAPYSDSLTISIIDDAPVANDVVQDVPESEEKVFNIIFTLDDSGSMAWGAITGDTTPPPSEPTRMDIAKESLAALGAEYFNQSTQVEITLITFNSSASFVGTYSDFASFEAALNGVTPGGGTNYVDATDEIQTQLVTDLAGQNPADDVQNISYFISDGEANSGTSPIGSGYIEFANDNSIDSYSVGIGSSLPGDLSDLNYIHNIDSLGQGGGTVDEALIVTDVSELESELLSTVPTAFGGNITANGSVSNVLFGADGGYVQSFTIDLGGTDYTFSYDGSTITVPAALAATVVVSGSTIELGSDDGFAFGTFTFNFADGAYTLSAPNGLAPSVFDFDYTVIDGDGDTASATATINIIDDAPDARDDLHSLDPFEVAAGNVITALGTDGGPQFGSSISPFTSQGGGVDKIVDNAVVTEFTYKGSTISIDSADLSGTLLPDPIGSSENIEVDSQANVDASNFSISGFSGGSPASLDFDSGGGDQGVGVGNDRLDNGESLLVDFDLAALPYGVDNLNLTMNQFGGSEAVDITVYDVDDVTVLGSFTHPASSGSVIDLSAFNGIGSVQIANNSGGNSTLHFVDYDPTPAPTTGGDNGSNLTWTFSVETDLDGNDIYQATVSDSNDGSEFIMRSNGFYQFTPDQTGGPIDVSTDTTSQANVDADPNINVSIRAGGSNLEYSGDGVGVEGGNGQLLSSGEALLITFDAVAAPDGINNLILKINDFQSANNDQATVIVTHDTDGDGFLSTDTVVLSASGSGSETLDLSQFSGVTQFDIEYTGSGYDLGLGNISYQIPATVSVSTLEPQLIDYTLTDTDGQSDTAQLALYTIDQSITGTSGIDNIAGGSLNDAIIGDDGDDILAGNAGHDSLSGGAGDDTLSGGIGNDYLAGGDGQDSLSGGAGNDTLDGGADDDLVDGSSGDDVVLGGAGDDLVFGGSGDDRLEGGAGDDVLSGGSGNDVIFGGAGDDRINGGSGNDSLVGGDGIDIFALESGDEGTIGVPAIDTIADFTLGVGGDVLDLSDMLQGEDLGSLDGFMNFSYDGASGDTTISIDVDGDSGTFETAQQIVLSGVDLTSNGTLTDSQILDNLLNNGNLVVDQ